MMDHGNNGDDDEVVVAVHNPRHDNTPMVAVAAHE